MNSTLSTVELFQFYYTPILVYMGGVGNMLSVYVFLTPKLRKLTSSYYLSALAISDTVFLIALFIVWLAMIEIDVFNQTGACQILVYLTSTCSFLSVWFVVAFTIERFVAVHYPLLRHSICTVQRAKIILVFLVIFAMILFSPLLIFAGTQVIKNNTLCSVEPEWQHLAGIFNIIDTVITFLIPVVIIVALNTKICRAIWKLNTTRQILMVRRVVLQKNVKTLSTMDYLGSQMKITKMLLIVSSTFLCFNLPSYVMRVLAYMIEFQVLPNINLVIFLKMQHWCLQLFNTNFGINFILYCISGQNFRKAVQISLCSKIYDFSTSFSDSPSRIQSTSSSSKRNRSTNQTVNTDIREVIPPQKQTNV